MRGNGRVDITPGVQTAWGRDGFTHRPGLTRTERNHADILLEQWQKVVDAIRKASSPINLEIALGGKQESISLREGGQLLSREYAYERALLQYSSYPSVLDALPLPGDSGVSKSSVAGASPLGEEWAPSTVDSLSQAVSPDAASPVLRAATQDDRVLFEQEGRWGERSWQERSAAIKRSLRIAAESGVDHADEHGELFYARDLYGALNDGDVDAWRRVWYLCRGITPPGSDYHRYRSEARSSHADLAATDGVQSVDRAPERINLLDAELVGSDPTSDDGGLKSTGCRGACKNFRAGYARDYWEITDENGERATHADLARRYAVGERQVQRFIAGCPDRQTKQPRHPVLDWPPIRP